MVQEKDVIQVPEMMLRLYLFGVDMHCHMAYWEHPVDARLLIFQLRSYQQPSPWHCSLAGRLLLEQHAVKLA